MKFKQITSPGCPIQVTSQIWLRATSGFWASKSYAGREFIRNGGGPERKVDGRLMPIRHQHSEQYLRNGKVDCCDALKQVENIFKRTPSQRYTYITRGYKRRDRTVHTPDINNIQEVSLFTLVIKLYHDGWPGLYSCFPPYSAPTAWFCPFPSRHQASVMFDLVQPRSPNYADRSPRAPNSEDRQRIFEKAPSFMRVVCRFYLAVWLPKVCPRTI
jgi:hypothetical protein